MKKVYLMAIIVFGFTTVIKAGGMEGLKGIDFANLDFEKMAEMEVAPVKAAVPANIVKDKTNKELVGQDLVDKFTRVRNSLRRLSSNTTWLDNDIDRLERDARRIAGSGKPDPFFDNSLRGLSTSINRYANDARRVYEDIRNLLDIAVKSDDLNKVVRDMQWDARDLHNDAQFKLENAARNLEWAVRSVKPELIGHNAQWMAFDITRNVRDYSWKVRDIYYGVLDLERKTQP
ncbi:MAG: hypothetical protein KAJ48_10525 [Elusimicrobiales bacterium]|nr:hypothetical protein [Elusimicrobiales bacterium]